MTWTMKDIPDQSGLTAVVTGANSGIGFETARGLAHAGADVILACRNPDRGQQAVDRISGESPAGTLELSLLDLSSLASVRDFTNRIAAAHDKVDLLVLNAGVMVPPFTKTEDGFELQFGTNYLGHFALTALLWDQMLDADTTRVVHVSSMAHKFGRIDFDNLDAERGYRRWAAYGQSKLANLLFAHELQRRLGRSGSPIRSVAAHPGWTATHLQDNDWWARTFNPLFAQAPEQGALPTLYAATAADVSGGDYYGPDGLFEMRGGPRRVGSTQRARDPELAAQLWSTAEQLTEVAFPAIA